MWLNGKQHGEGLVIQADGQEKRGEWKVGQLLQWKDKSRSDDDLFVDSNTTTRQGTSKFDNIRKNASFDS